MSPSRGTVGHSRLDSLQLTMPTHAPLRPTASASVSPGRVLASLRISLGTIWAAAACLLGLWLISLALLDADLAVVAESQTPSPASPASFGLVGGVALFAMGQFVFVTVVADRVCPAARRLITYPVHLVLAAVYLLGLLYLVLSAVGLLNGPIKG
jgi:hypothetical protein